MKTMLYAILACGLILTAAELTYVLSSPLIGEGDRAVIADTDGGIFPENDTAYLKSMSTVYGGYYDMRPHEKDPNKGLYLLTLTGWWVTDMSAVGINMWKTGIFMGCVMEKPNNRDSWSPEFLDSWVRHRPSVVSSQFAPVSLYMGAVSSDALLARGGWAGMRGKKLTLMSRGWLTLGDLAGSNSAFLFEDGCGAYNGLSSGEFLRRMAKTYEVYFARTAFVESVLEGGSAWDGILYAAYYPAYNKTFLAAYNIPEDKIRASKVIVDGKETNMEVTYPLIIVDTPLTDGEHQIVLSTPEKSYALRIYSVASALNTEPAATGLQSDGKFTTVLTHLNNTVRVGEVTGLLRGQEKTQTLGQTLNPYNSTQAVLQFDGPLTPGDVYDFDLRVSYEDESGPRWLNRTLMLSVE